jgi:Na+/H+ antiporter NhaD/arsenite permease-like protein
MWLPGLVWANPQAAGPIEFGPHSVGWLALAIFALGILLVSLEEFLELPKSKPMLLAAGLIWLLIGWSSTQHDEGVHLAEAAVRENLLQYAELMLLILVVMTYINAMTERRVFSSLRVWLGSQGYSYRRLFWITGLATFLLSPFLDNLSTALLLGAVVIKVGQGNPRFIGLGSLNVVIAANAGGVFSPFGDITTLMVWQQDIHSTTGRVDFFSFFQLVLPAAVSYLIPALGMHFALPGGRLEDSGEAIPMRRGAKRIILLFLLTIATAVAFQSLLHLPAVIGMLTGLSYLQFFGFYLKKTHGLTGNQYADEDTLTLSLMVEGHKPFDIFVRVARAEWDTLLFLGGVILAVGGLGHLGFLAQASELMYNQWGPTTANILVGIASAVLENIPTMSAVLTMNPQMSLEQWLLVTLTTGIGGSLLAIGSAAGVALMGQAKGHYTFFSHLKWTPLIALAYALGILVHLVSSQTIF